ncbi:hypothetical protein, partial [Cupriavidus sp. 8B]
AFGNALGGSLASNSSSQNSSGETALGQVGGRSAQEQAIAQGQGNVMSVGSIYGNADGPHYVDNTPTTGMFQGDMPAQQTQTAASSASGGGYYWSDIGEPQTQAERYAQTFGGQVVNTSAAGTDAGPHSYGTLPEVTARANAREDDDGFAGRFGGSTPYTGEWTEVRPDGEVVVHASGAPGSVTGKSAQAGNLLTNPETGLLDFAYSARLSRQQSDAAARAANQTQWATGPQLVPYGAGARAAEAQVAARNRYIAAVQGQPIGGLVASGVFLASGSLEMAASAAVATEPLDSMWAPGGAGRARSVASIGRNGRIGGTPISDNAAEGSLVNPRLIQRLDAWRSYQENGGQLDLQGWVQRTQGAPWGTGFSSGYGAWARGVESVHGNSVMSGREASLYRLEDAASGNLLKWGISQDMNSRYSGGFMLDKQIFEVSRGSRADILRQERELVETQPGPLNREPWAGKRR